MCAFNTCISGGAHGCHVFVKMWGERGKSREGVGPPHVFRTLRLIISIVRCSRGELHVLTSYDCQDVVFAHAAPIQCPQVASARNVSGGGTWGIILLFKLIWHSGCSHGR